MNDAILAHPGLDQLTAFAQGRLGEAELAQVHAHLSECTECQSKVELTGDDTLVALLRSADTKSNAPATNEPAVTIAAAKPAVPDLPAELAQHSRYRVQELLGVGGMGAVYKAEHLLMERPVALKLINHSLTSDRGMVERFRREVKTAGLLKHPNIVLAYDAEQAGDSHFLVMEYVEGKSLARIVAERGPLPVRAACDYIRQAALGLQYAHERGMVHRDIKPQNLMLTPDGQVKILDFGLARFAMETAPTPLAALPADPSLTQVGIVMGTPDYIAPEQAKDAHTADIRADIYSLGCTLYDLLAGHAPFAEGTLTTKVIAHTERMPTPLNKVRGDVLPELARIVERMMAKDPARRYQSPAEVATALARFASPATRSRGRRVASIAAAVILAITLGILGSYFSTTMYRIVTNHGELIVEVDDSQVEVVLKHADIVVRDLAANREYAVQVRRQDLKAGDYLLQVKDKGGMEVFTKQFTITRNGTTLVKITLRHEAAGQSDRDRIQGTWKPVTVSVQGQQVPDTIFKSVGPSVTFAGTKVTWKTTPAPAAKDLFGGMLAKFSLEGVFHLDPAKSPKTMDLTVLGPGARTPLGTPAPRALLGIYRLDGDTLEICTAIDPDHPEERPDKFASIPGKRIVHMILKRAPAAGRLINSFGTGFTPITRDGVAEDAGGWRIENTKARFVRLYEVQPPLEDCLVTYRAKIKSANLKGKAYLEMLAHPRRRRVLLQGIDQRHQRHHGLDRRRDAVHLAEGRTARSLDVGCPHREPRHGVDQGHRAMASAIAAGA